MNLKRWQGANMKKFAVAATALLLIVSFQNCSQQKLSHASGESSGGRGPLNLGNTDNDATGVITQTGGPNCRNQLNTLTTPIKPVFIVDVSGSNFTNGATPGSDPKRIVRGDSIERFFNTFKAKPNFGWSFSTFAGSIANVLLQMGNATSMSNAIATFRAMSDAGNTPYIAAMDAAKSNIMSDAARTADTRYMVVFLSDGLPNPAVSDATLSAKVQEVIGVVPGKVSFNTIYYGNQDQVASDRLKMMAQVGGGNFLDTNANPTGSNFLITDFVVIPSVVCN
jgi:hypothetical protein